MQIEMKSENIIYCRDAIGRYLGERIAATFRPADGEGPRLLSFSVEIGAVSVIDWLSVQHDPAKVYWSGRDGDIEIAGIGRADVVDLDCTSDVQQALSVIEENLHRGSGGVRYYGGMAFDSLSAAGRADEAFDKFYFFVPKFELRRQESCNSLLFNILAYPKDDKDSVIDSLNKSLDSLCYDAAELQRQAGCDLPTVIGRSDLPEKKGWLDNVNELVERIRGGQVEKVVLSRICTLELSEEVNPAVLLDHVKRDNVNTYDFCFQIDGHSSFIGCSPECLYRVDGSEIYSESIAGTKAVGKTERANKSLQEELLGSEKEAEEHEYVFQDVKAALNEICQSFSVASKNEILELSHVQHFRSRFDGIVKQGIGNIDILNALHPTAAVNGFPRDASMAMIRRYESYGRGWYAGPVGWIGRDSADFAVGIRSAYVCGDRVDLYAGAGIVAASDADEEWQETETKLAQFLKVLKPFTEF
jgi:menaquinone-specific isochorismate synthase